MKKLTPLPEWCEQVGLDYQRGWRLAKRGEIDVTRLGSRYYVLGDGLGGPERAECEQGEEDDGELVADVE
ncbi:hypothetical protein FIV42_15375 [Persicimonas caeni]|uniref:Excisionase n=1 Tax=Persicimonas caeni TaxID=2292766 RepID=A0A4Y6PUZ7_PERCE|nr:hypothetical protein [Persicimonas caeni]QDG52073.1 hypothetical protein FIV42_15375 [Persicimonas caeni]QED33294.1 hypothetical protein FRD00_15370 [Persicimonas caeni]